MLGLDIDGTDLTIVSQAGVVALVRTYWIKLLRSAITNGPDRDRKTCVPH